MRRTLLLVVIAHFLIAGWHGFTHQMVPVPLTPAQTAFVVLVILLAPLAGAALVLRDRLRAGALVVFASMAASLAFGVAYHFVVISPDNITCVPPGPWRGDFVASSIAVAVSEALGTLCGGLAWWRSAAPAA